MMKARNIQEMIRAKGQIERGAATPARVWDVRSDGNGGFTRKVVDPKAFRRRQKTAWDKSIAATRQKLGLKPRRAHAKADGRWSQLSDCRVLRHNSTRQRVPFSLQCPTSSKQSQPLPFFGLAANQDAPRVKLEAARAVLAE